MNVFAVVDEISSKDGYTRARFIQSWIDKQDLMQLMEFQSSAVKAYRSIFNDRMASLYGFVFSGQANESGFIDFISNIVLFGSACYQKALNCPDDLSQFDTLTEWDEDFGIHIAEVALQKINTLAEDANCLITIPIPSLEGVWEQITLPRSEMFRLDQDMVRLNFPKTSARIRL